MTDGTGKPKKESLVSPTASARTTKRQEEAKRRRQERQSSYARNKRDMMIAKIVGLVVVVAVVAVIGYRIYDKSTSDIPAGVVSYNYVSNQHDDNFNSWTENPPVGGIHNQTWQKCQFYPAPIMTGKGVHSMEHGAVWITFDPNLPQDQIDKIKAIADGQDFILASPYPGLPKPIVLSSWDHQLQLDAFDQGKIDQFIKVFKHSKTYTPEYNANCATGDTSTVG